MKKKLNDLIDLYTDTFCDKQGVSHNGWTGDVKGGIIEISDAFLSFEDIRRDLDYNVAPKKIFDWYWNYSDTINHKTYIIILGNN